MKVLNALKAKANHFYFLLALVSVFSLSSCQDEQAEIVPEEVAEEVSKEETGPQVENAAFLRQQESLGGHTIERHIAKSDAYLRNRLNTSNISAASTFTELNQAGQVIVNAINANSSRVNSWRNSSSSSLVLNYTHRRTVGRIMYRSNLNSTVNSSGLRIVLRKRSSAPNGYYVLTAYPN